MTDPASCRPVRRVKAARPCRDVLAALLLCFWVLGGAAAAQGEHGSANNATLDPLNATSIVPCHNATGANGSTVLCPNGTASPVAAGASTNTSSSGGGGHGGTPSWQTGLLTVLISLVVIMCAVVVFAIAHKRMRRERRRVLQAVVDLREAESATFHAADLEAARRWHAATVRLSEQRRQAAAAAQRAAGGQRQGPPPRQQPVVVIQPDMGLELCVREESAAQGQGRDGAGKQAGAGAAGVATAGEGGSSQPPAHASQPQTAAEGARNVTAGGAAARGAVASLQTDAQSQLQLSLSRRVTATALPRHTLPATLPPAVQRLAIDVTARYPALCGTVLLLLPPHAWVGLGAGGSGGEHVHQPPPLTSVDIRPLEDVEERGQAQAPLQAPTQSVPSAEPPSAAGDVAEESAAGAGRASAARNSPDAGGQGRQAADEVQGDER